jgi:hypothetical protein
MTPIEFVMWLKGFGDAIFSTPTQAQWDIIKKKMNEVGSPVVDYNPNPMWQEPAYPNPLDKYKITCEGKSATEGIITNGTTTWTNLPTGANVSYTIDK